MWFFIALKIIGFILLGLLLLIIIALFIPIHVNFRYDQKLEVRFRVLFYKKQLYPKVLKKSKKKKEEKKGVEKKENKNTDEHKQKNKNNPLEILDFIIDALPTIKRGLKIVGKQIHIRNFEFLWKVHFEDMMSSAELYGRVQGAIAVLTEAASRFFNMKKYRVHTEIDFLEEGNLIKSKGDLYVRLISIIFLLPTAWRLYQQYQKLKQNPKK